MGRVLLTLFVLWICAPLPSRAQPRRATQAALGAEAQARLTRVDTLLAFRTRPVPGGRLDLDAGVLRAAYRLPAGAAGVAAPEASARSYLSRHADAFGWPAGAEDLEVTSVRREARSSHVVFQQTYRGVPVFQRRVKVNLDAEGRPTMVLSAYAPHLRRVPGLQMQPAMTAEEARTRAAGLVQGGGALVGTPELVVYPSEAPRLAWHVLVGAADAEWSVVLDAHTGAVVQVVDQAVRRSSKAEGNAEGDGEAYAQMPEKAGFGAYPALSPPSEPGVRRFADGSGFVFDPDPLTTANRTYQPPYVDNNDNNAPELNGQRVLVTLPEITRGSDDFYRLEGPHIRIVPQNNAGQPVYSPPFEAAPDDFRYTRSDEGFEAVMAYYHIDKSQRYIQELGFTDVVNLPLAVNPQGLTSDDSFYFPGSRLIVFGTGGVDDAEDASVIWHEYAHAMLDDVAPGLLNTTEGSVFHEGWADYWAASYVRSLVENDASKRSDWELMFKWDSGDGTVWPGRSLDHTGHYPQDLPCISGGGLCDKHRDGTLWATTLMQIYSDLGRTVTDQLNLQSHRYLSAPVTLRDAAEALIQADQDLFGGTHTEVLLTYLGARGLVNAGAFGPVVSHEALHATEQLGGTVPVLVQARGISSPIEDVFVFYQVDGGAYEQLLLTEQENDEYSAALPLPDAPADVSYYVEAVDGAGRQTFLPSDAPVQTFRFTTGPDMEPPEVEHQAIQAAALALWPAEVVADVEDNLGVDSVWVEFTVEDPDGAVVQEGSFGLAAVQGSYRGAFPVPVGALQKDSLIRYRLRARDAAQAANERTVPANGTFDFVITAEGVLQYFSFEQTGSTLDATGSWAWGAPAYGLEVAHSGDRLWATAPDAAYPAAGGRASLDLPPLNLTGVGATYLVFWHWYDLEHDGTAQLGRTDGGLWDGGNVKLSTDGGATWSIVTPLGGYSGTLLAGQGNPMGGERAFGGYSTGWRREVVPLPPVSSELRLRFDFGSDATNEEVSAFGYAGWYLDDITITTLEPEDDSPPEALALPGALRIQPVGDDLLPLSARFDDDTGVADVFVDYEVTRDGQTTEETRRLEMSTTDLSLFGTANPAWEGLGSGDAVAYRLRVSDFDGNEVYFPPLGEAAFRVEVQRVEQVSALGTVAASGVWQPTGSAWRLATGVEAPERSSLVFNPVDVPWNAASATLTLEQFYNLGDGLGGNVKVSIDDGQTWAVLGPDDLYPRKFSAQMRHPMRREPVFAGGRSTVHQVVFDLTPYAGEQVRLRIDLGAERPVEETEFWVLLRADLTSTTLDDEFDRPRELALLANFPNPFATTTTLGYTLPEAGPVRLEVYDMLGRRVAVLVDRTQEAGTYTLTYDAGGLGGGVYLLRLLAGGAQKVRQLIVTP